jgi:hypothetical protein
MSAHQNEHDRECEIFSSHQQDGCDDRAFSPDDSSDNKLEKTKTSRRVLTEDEVIAIFSAGKLRPGASTVKIWARGQILALAKKFNVTPKTIRDIWNRRTWRGATSRLILENSLSPLISPSKQVIFC